MLAIVIRKIPTNKKKKGKDNLKTQNSMTKMGFKKEFV